MRGTAQLTKIAILNQEISILARTLISQGPGFANISENKVLANISESTVSNTLLFFVEKMCPTKNNRVLSYLHLKGVLSSVPTLGFSLNFA